jgi:hypothetical protein
MEEDRGIQEPSQVLLFQSFSFVEITRSDPSLEDGRLLYAAIVEETATTDSGLW